jgi:hypothetical protein
MTDATDGTGASSATDPGTMILYDAATPPLYDGSYMLTVDTAVSGGGLAPSPPVMTQDHYFDVVGPRFAVPASMVAGTFPPKNKLGDFSQSLPQLVLSRRSLPWERNIDPAQRLSKPAGTAAPPLAGPVPWVALLLFEGDEATLVRNVPLQNVLPAQVFSDLAPPPGITCDAVQVSADVLSSIMPSLNELQLLCHVRQVNVDYREIQTASGDGYYAVVVSSRLPSPGAQCLAVLVSLEGRDDVIGVNPPAVAPDGGDRGGVTAAPVAGTGRAEAVTYPTTGTAIGLSRAPVTTLGGGISIAPIQYPQQTVWLVALTSWQFTCAGPQTFQSLMQNLDVSMFGSAPVTGHPPVTDTGHLPVTLQDRLGASETVLFRGPLVQYNLTRDDLGPYHSADQARRVTPETGAEDISYAAAFEAGRLLAAADARLAQALMRWRRESYKQSARQSTIGALAADVTLALPATTDEQLHTPIAPLVAVSATQSIAGNAPPAADVHGLAEVQSYAGLQPAELASAWGISAAEATTLLGGAGTLGEVAEPPATTPRADTSLADVAADTAGLARLSAARAQVQANATRWLEAPDA